MLPQMRRKSRAEKRRLVATMGGKALVASYGVEHMREIGKLGGRPTFFEGVERAWARWNSHQPK